jgi:hypothetical protein
MPRYIAEPKPHRRFSVYSPGALKLLPILAAVYEGDFVIAQIVFGKLVTALVV